MGEEESIYERVARLEDEVATLRNEVDILKGTTRNKIIRYEHKLMVNVPVIFSNTSMIFTNSIRVSFVTHIDVYHTCICLFIRR